jgi:hypothetical protein
MVDSRRLSKHAEMRNASSSALYSLALALYGKWKDSESAQRRAIADVMEELTTSPLSSVAVVIM